VNGAELRGYLNKYSGKLYAYVFKKTHRTADVSTEVSMDINRYRGY
jgi:hypothetical protein